MAFLFAGLLCLLCAACNTDDDPTDDPNNPNTEDGIIEMQFINSGYRVGFYIKSKEMEINWGDGTLKTIHLTEDTQ
jgi:hypothetical protein